MSDQTITSLIEKLEGAEVGDEDLSLEVNLALEGGEAVPKTSNYTMEPCWAIRRPNENYVGGFENGPNYPVTQSLDAALALAERVNPRFGWQIEYDSCVSVNYAWVSETLYLDGPQFHLRGRAATPALAICAAILRAQSEAR